jgi:hypothetical protein
LGADTTTGKDCAWADLLKGVDVGTGTGVIWIGRLNDDWLQIIHRGIDVPDALPRLSAGHGQALLLSWNAEGAGDLVYAADGAYATFFSLTRPNRRGGPHPHALDAYAEGLVFDVQDSSWENDPDLPEGWMEYTAWEEARVEGDMSDDDYEDMRPEWWDLQALAINGYSPPLATAVTSALALVGRVTGRELDKAWMREIHTRFLMASHNRV